MSIQSDFTEFVKFGAKLGSFSLSPDFLLVGTRCEMSKIVRAGLVLRIRKARTSKTGGNSTIVRGAARDAVLPSVSAAARKAFFLGGKSTTR